eukprot:gnl/TRDRNA2_/TRDRNA2_174516_c2_seq27.p1 gnl/TRDRNA2_/TRDRNA2_174516_c2~~gnl/TRDRNA2_/TRDRNA2_174516_c2_seq27.p1  ORF type:complete len:316 (+),score=35.23 gnl/TRDRNA2_/TRDRNA2_174516_c2_seq27:93-1040(+)
MTRNGIHRTGVCLFVCTLLFAQVERGLPLRIIHSSGQEVLVQLQGAEASDSIYDDDTFKKHRSKHGHKHRVDWPDVPAGQAAAPAPATEFWTAKEDVTSEAFVLLYRPNPTDYGEPHARWLGDAIALVNTHRILIKFSEYRKKFGSVWGKIEHVFQQTLADKTEETTPSSWMGGSWGSWSPTNWQILGARTKESDETDFREVKEARNKWVRFGDEGGEGRDRYFEMTIHQAEKAEDSGGADSGASQMPIAELRILTDPEMEDLREDATQNGNSKAFQAFLQGMQFAPHLATEATTYVYFGHHVHVWQDNSGLTTA